MSIEPDTISIILLVVASVAVIILVLPRRPRRRWRRLDDLAWRNAEDLEGVGVRQIQMRKLVDLETGDVAWVENWVGSTGDYGYGNLPDRIVDRETAARTDRRSWTPAGRTIQLHNLFTATDPTTEEE